jgi:hypothetical protein
LFWCSSSSTQKEKAMFFSVPGFPTEIYSLIGSLHHKQTLRLCNWLPL